MSPDVPQEAVEQIEYLFDELNSTLEASGWENPTGQLEWIADRLEYYAAKFHQLGAIQEKQRIEKHRCLPAE